MTTGCARCGDCCDPVYLDHGVWTRAVARRKTPARTSVSSPLTGVRCPWTRTAKASDCAATSSIPGHGSAWPTTAVRQSAATSRGITASRARRPGRVWSSLTARTCGTCRRSSVRLDRVALSR